ncbi:hypothetical protein PCCS19_21320 [Paenibacillus sp. CCS19]|nr:hypothetical protein PCCS19_21320 [Paenibacillus cellulosilyticus]
MGRAKLKSYGRYDTLSGGYIEPLIENNLRHVFFYAMVGKLPEIDHCGAFLLYNRATTNEGNKKLRKCSFAIMTQDASRGFSYIASII